MLEKVLLTTGVVIYFAMVLKGIQILNEREPNSGSVGTIVASIVAAAIACVPMWILLSVIYLIWN